MSRRIAEDEGQIADILTRYCYGAVFTSHFNTTGDVQASVFCHPSMLKVADMETWRAPVSFALAEEDHSFSPKLHSQAEAALKGKPFESEFVVYQGTAHGFACRPNLAIEEVKKGFEVSPRSLSDVTKITDASLYSGIYGPDMFVLQETSAFINHTT
jgi:dienelactone hydrolase